MPAPFRIGYGYDVHRLQQGPSAFLGGVLIPSSPHGAIGHSDADVLLHAVCDALLGALALGDIGTHFPDTDLSYKGIDSKILLQKTYELVAHSNYKISNIDCTVLLESPKIMKYADEMRHLISNILNLNMANISIKASTSESMGFVGRQEGVAAHAIALLYRNE